MASPSGTEDPIVDFSDRPEARYAMVSTLLHKTPCEFEFFQAVRLLERLSPSRAPVGRFVSPGREVVRFSAHVSFPFPAS